jgi:hypothetical protein
VDVPALTVRRPSLEDVYLDLVGATAGVSTDKSAEASWVGTGFALIAVGAVLAFTFTGEVLGLDVDVDVVGWLLMTVGVIVVVAAAIRRLPRLAGPLA